MAIIDITLLVPYHPCQITTSSPSIALQWLGQKIGCQFGDFFINDHQGNIPIACFSCITLPSLAKSLLSVIKSHHNKVQCTIILHIILMNLLHLACFLHSWLPFKFKFFIFDSMKNLNLNYNHDYRKKTRFLLNTDTLMGKLWAARCEYVWENILCSL